MHRTYVSDLGLHAVFDRVKHVCYYYSINHLARHIVTWRDLYLFSGVYWMSLQVQLFSVINASIAVICRWFLGRLKPTQYIVRVWMGHYYGIHTLLFRVILETQYGVELNTFDRKINPLLDLGSCTTNFIVDNYILYIANCIVINLK